MEDRLFVQTISLRNHVGILIDPSLGPFDQ